MWNDRLRIVESVLPQWRGLAAHEREKVRAAMQLIDDDPIIGAPLFEPLRGYWSYRVEHLRILYRIVSEARFIVILSISRVAETGPR
jgi:mRNA-degrading endonuclease RelE of RelBE toxin-antitoxin system